MTMMSRNSSDSSLDEEQESTVSSRSGGISRKSLNSFINSNRRTRGERDASVSLSDDCSDMPSLSSFRLEDMSASVASRGSSYASRGECDISLPSLSSFRMDEMSLASSYHSGTNQMSEESAEGWSSFTSGNVSADTDSEDEFASSSKGEHHDGESSRTRGRPVSKSGILKTREVSEGTIPSSPAAASAANKDCNLTSNARPPRRRSPETEDMKSSLPMRRPRRTLSPKTNSHHSDKSSEPNSTPLKQDKTARSSRSSSPDRTPVERTESLPLSVLQKPTRSATTGDSSSSVRLSGESSSSVRLSGDSSSTLKGGDSLPRLPRRTSTMDDRSTHAEEDGDDEDDTKLSAEASRVSEDDDTKISYDDVTEVSEGDVSIDSDLSDDDSSNDDIVRRMPLHHRQISKHFEEKKRHTNSHEGQIVKTRNSIPNVVRATSGDPTKSDSKKSINQKNGHIAMPVRPSDSGKETNTQTESNKESSKSSRWKRDESRVGDIDGVKWNKTTKSRAESSQSKERHNDSNDKSKDSPTSGTTRQQERADGQEVPSVVGISTDHRTSGDSRAVSINEASKRTDQPSKSEPGESQNRAFDSTSSSYKVSTTSTSNHPYPTGGAEPYKRSIPREPKSSVPSKAVTLQKADNRAGSQSKRLDDHQPKENESFSATNSNEATDGKPSFRNRKSPTSVCELEGSLPSLPSKASSDDQKSPTEDPGTTSAEESGTTSSETEGEESEDVRNNGSEGDGKNGKKEPPKRGLLRKMSNSFKHIGKSSSSLKNSFRMIGRTASKLKHMGGKREDGKTD